MGKGRRASLLIVAAIAAGAAPIATLSPSASGATPHDASVPTPVTKDKTVSRTHLVDGQDQVVDTKKVGVTVSQTDQLRSQRISVSWTGAHPTGGVVSNAASADARYEEYPMMLVECRGTDDPSLPAAQQVSPSTCWTQTPRERYEESRGANFPPYRVDRYATPADRQATVDQPSCADAPVGYYVPFVDTKGTSFPGGGCAASPPEETADSTTDHPGNTLYGSTDPDGTGRAIFTVWDDGDNASLGCSATVACTLVAVPIMGISCDIAAAGEPPADRPDPSDTSADGATASSKTCMATGKFKQTTGPGAGNSGNVDLAVTGALWWSASNWRNRISFPLTFAPSASVCSVTGGQPSVDVYGSELLVQATGQWSPYLCTGGGAAALRHVQTGEPQARSLVQTGGIEAGFLTFPPDGGFTTPTVMAPTALTGFSISYVIDDAVGKPYHDLKLNARLLAKLLSESYTATPDRDHGGDFADPDHPISDITGNPATIESDPEFQALNPALKKLPSIVGRENQPQASMIFLSSDSDVVQALTSYVIADPEAKRWLDGVPDPWGMRVNPHYRINYPEAELSLPLNNWPLLDTVEPRNLYTGDTANDCLKTSPVPYLPLVAAPQGRLFNITRALTLAAPTSTLICSEPIPDDPRSWKLVTGGVQTPGSRFIIGLTPLADTSRYVLDSAALQTASSASASAKVTDTTGRSFANPTDATLKAAGALLSPDSTTGTWDLPYDTLRQHADAYPGTMLVSTAVPTTGLPSGDASNLAGLLRFFASTAQTPGLGNGQLPSGYLPLTAADGLGGLAAYTKVAADAVAAQAGTVPPLIPVAAVASPSPAKASPTPKASSTRVASPAASPVASPAAPVASGAAPVSAPAPVASTPAAVVASAIPPDVASPSEPAPLAVAKTVGTGAGAAGAVLPLLLLVLIAGAASAWITAVRSTKGSA